MLYKGNKLITGLAILAASLLILLALISSYAVRKATTTSHQNQEFITCVLDWANQTTHRSGVLTDANQRRTDALDLIIRDVALAQNPKEIKTFRTKFPVDLQSYVTASNNYNKVVREHPVPKSPKLACANVKG